MYGIVNKAVKELILNNYDEVTWQKIKEHSGVDIEVFLSNKSYDDAITYQLATSASAVLETPLEDILFALGEFWILNTGMKNYGSLLKAGGKTLKDFFINLPDFHSRVMLMFNDLVPPEFKITNIQEKSIDIHYFSHRESLQPFVKGILSGCAKMYEEDVQIDMIQSRLDSADHEIFKITWN